MCRLQCLALWSHIDKYRCEIFRNVSRYLECSNTSCVPEPINSACVTYVSAALPSSPDILDGISLDDVLWLMGADPCTLIFKEEHLFNYIFIFCVLMYFTCGAPNYRKPLIQETPNRKRSVHLIPRLYYNIRWMLCLNLYGLFLPLVILMVPIRQTTRYRTWEHVDLNYWQ